MEFQLRCMHDYDEADTTIKWVFVAGFWAHGRNNKYWKTTRQETNYLNPLLGNTVVLLPASCRDRIKLLNLNLKIRSSLLHFIQSLEHLGRSSMVKIDNWEWIIKDTDWNVLNLYFVGEFGIRSILHGFKREKHLEKEKLDLVFYYFKHSFHISVICTNKLVHSYRHLIGMYCIEMTFLKCLGMTFLWHLMTFWIGAI